ncbi:MAG: DUF4190 domain-containing protein [Syntrophothermus sp.]
MNDAGLPPPTNNRTPAPTSTLSLASLMMGIISWVLLPVVGGIIAVVTGHMAKKEIRQSDGLLGGDGLATAGLVLGYSNMVLGLCGCLIVLLFPVLFAAVRTFGDQIFR